MIGFERAVLGVVLEVKILDFNITTWLSRIITLTDEFWPI